MKDNSLFNEQIIQRIKNARKAFLKLAVWILIAELAVGAVIILAGSWDIAVGRVQLSFLILSLILFISVNNFIRMEKGSKAVQVFALISFIGDLIWGLLAILLLWEAVPYYETREIVRTSNLFGSYSYGDPHMSIYAITMLISGYTAAFGFWVSNVLSIKETIKIVQPLKITAIVCVAYIWVYEIASTLIEPEYRFGSFSRYSQLSLLAGLAFVTTALAALIISKTNKKKSIEPGQAQFVPKTDAELRAEIEEKVRREMIEKEVRAQIEAEQANANNLSDSEENPDISSDQQNMF